MIRAERIIGNARLLLGDCADTVHMFGECDALITDPPYGIRHKFGVQNKLNGVRALQFAWDHGCSNNPRIVASLSKFCELAQAFFTFCGPSQVSHIEDALSDRFTVKPAVWIKSCPPPAMPGNWWPSGFELALYGYRPGAYFADADASRCNVFYTDTYRHGIRAAEKVDHPTQKWLPLIERIVAAMTLPSGIVIDPFMGSGTTGVACARLGRRFIGCEIHEPYFDIACRRIDQAQRQPDLFVLRADRERAEQHADLFAERSA